MNEFGEPELLDDILDHWSSSAHVEEKKVLLSKLQTFASQRGCRVTLFSGDVHQCVYCWASSTKDFKDIVTDPGFMPQARLLATFVHAQAAHFLAGSVKLLCTSALVAAF